MKMKNLYRAFLRDDVFSEIGLGELSAICASHEARSCHAYMAGNKDFKLEHELN